MIENIAVPSYCSLYQIDDQYQQASTTIDILSKHLSISRPEAMKMVMTGLMEEQGLDLHIAVPIRDLAVELLHCNNLMMGLMGLQTDDETGQMTTKKGVSVAVIEAPPKTYTCPFTGMEFVFVKGGKFMMGDIWGDGRENEYPAHEVELDDFYMGKYPVTQGQWKKVMGSNPSDFKKCGDNCPVESVSWDDAQEFIKKLNPT